MDKVQKIREVIEKRYEYWKEKESNSHSIESEIRMSECQHLLLMLDSLQEEPVSVWHDKDEEPDEDRQVLINLSGFCYVDFYHKEDKRFYMFGNPKHYLCEVDKWAYIDDLLNLSNVQRTVKDLKEPERIRKVLVELISTYLRGNENGKIHGVYAKDILAWLEKKGEQNLNPCDGCINRKGCINCENGELREVEQKPAESNDIKGILLVHDEILNNLLERYKTSATFKTLIVNLKNWWNNTRIHLLSFNIEQKPTDKVEPKFHEGEWITNGDYYWKIVEVKPLDYIIQSQDRNIVDDTISHVDEQFHSFTIEDAKEGDVLACPNDAGDRDVVFIFKNINSDEGWVFCFCASDANGCFCTDNDYVGNSNSTNISPATKEQRDLLFQKMKEAGYEWDAEKKELRRIKQNPTENEELTEFDKAVGVSIGTWNPKTPEQIKSVKAVSKKLLKLAKKQINDEQNHAWSEEDEEALEVAIIALEDMYSEDSPLDCYAGHHMPFDKAANQLKSLKERYTWKPSDEQMNTLEYYMHTLVCNEHKEILFGLYVDLKKLKGK